MPNSKSDHSTNAHLTDKPGFFRRHLMAEITLLLLLGFSYLGVTITDISPAKSKLYWLLMVPVFFFASLVTEWPHVRAGKYPWKTVIWNHTQQWLALLVAVELVFVIQEIGRLNNETTGLMLLLVFALSTFVAGIRMGWLFRLAGIFLAGSLLMLAYVERYLWVLLLLAFLLLLFHHFLVRFEHKHKNTAKPRLN